MHHVIVMGTRPEIIKMSPVITELKKRKEKFTLIDTGQHYDTEMSEIFYKELTLPQPDHIFVIPKNKPNQQIGFILERLLDLLPLLNADIVYAQGDTNTVMVTALACQRLIIPFGHVEAGLRSFDMTMPEEANRRIAGICASIHFCPTELSARNLTKEGIADDRIVVTGNTIVDAVKRFIKSNPPPSELLKELGLGKNRKKFLVMTLHRASNVDNKDTLRSILKTLIKVPYVVLFLIHPRTKNRIKKFELEEIVDNKNIFLHSPIGYFEFLNLLKESEGILTDSGGIQEEAITLKIPCIILRPNTERPEVILSGINSILDPKSPNFSTILMTTFKNLETFSENATKKENPFGDGKSAEKILNYVEKFIKMNKLAFKIIK